MLAIQQRLSRSFFVLLSLPSTAMGFALSVQISALSWILSTKYGLDIHDVGLVWAAGPIAGILGQVIVGIISDNVWFWGGRRRPFILVGGVLAALMLLALPQIDVISTSMGIDGILGVALVVALTLDLSINISFNPTRAIIADVTTEENRTKGYTWMQTISGSLGVLAYFIGGTFGNYFLIYFGAGLVLLFSVIPPFFIKEPTELEQPKNQPSADPASVTQILLTIRPLWGFFVYSVYAITLKLTGFTFDHYYIEIACLVFTLFMLYQSLSERTSGKDPDTVGQIGFRKVLAAHSLTWMGIQTMFVYMFAFIKFQLPESTDDELGRIISYSFLVFNLIAAILPAFILQPIALKIGKVKTHLLSISLMTFGYAGILFFGQSAMMIYVFMAVAGIGWAATVSLPFAIISSQVTQSKMGLYMGLFNLSVVLPQLVASLGIGEIISKAPDKNIVFIICTASIAASALAWMFVREPGINKTESTVQSVGGH